MILKITGPLIEIGSNCFQFKSYSTARLPESLFLGGNLGIVRPGLNTPRITADDVKSYSVGVAYETNLSPNGTRSLLPLENVSGLVMPELPVSLAGDKIDFLLLHGFAPYRYPLNMIFATRLLKTATQEEKSLVLLFHGFPCPDNPFQVFREETQEQESFPCLLTTTQQPEGNLFTMEPVPVSGSGREASNLGNPVQFSPLFWCVSSRENQWNDDPCLLSASGWLSQRLQEIQRSYQDLKFQPPIFVLEFFQDVKGTSSNSQQPWLVQGPITGLRLLDNQPVVYFSASLKLTESSD